MPDLRFSMFAMTYSPIHPLPRIFYRNSTISFHASSQLSRHAKLLLWYTPLSTQISTADTARIHPDLVVGRSALAGLAQE